MKILIVEDEKHLNDLLYDYLLDKYNHSEIDQVFDGFEAIRVIDEKTYDLVLLDVMLPNIDGFDICKHLRKNSSTPVIMLSALNDEENQIKGYDLGIDEFIPKPYSPKLVIKKVEAVLARYGIDNDKLLEYGLIKYNIEEHKILVEDEEVSLNKKEWDLFIIFINNKNRVFTRETLLDKVWGYDFTGYDRTVDTHIKRLRQKLNGASGYIKTIFKEGYKFEK
ncbi:Sensory transduction protein regX3 [Candidatus Izimaplasma bacterium HR1]|jgi:two-component system response regulator VanR|uniref:response regulator transcription factor n=1 Tax=Candidatus Izimoplasma sp. HR1 TaxID=1541959 RepID=UPI0004F7100B|nr:Sensory transduction protein regX3 [Candidatus Izimaplasma bacterium HR1]